MPTRTPFAIALVAILAAGCGVDPESGTPDAGPDPADPCAAVAASCVAKQQGCVSDSAGARCEPCTEGMYASPAGTCDPIGGAPLSHDFPSLTTKPGEESLGLCRSWTLNNAEELWINAVALDQDEASHHSNWTFVPDDQFAGPDGVWPCSDRNYDQLSAALVGGVLYAQSTQATHEVQKFPDSAAVRIPPYSRIISDIHLLNTGAADITGHARLTVYSLPVAEVKHKLAPFHLNYQALDIPPQASSRFTGSCAVREQFPGKLFPLKLYFILPHTHRMATRFFVDVLGGSDDGKNLLEVKGFTSEAHGRAFDPPVDMAAADGFTFGCDYQNTGTEAVQWGFGDGEMCELLGFAEANTAFESNINSTQSAGTDGTTALFTGPCETLAFPWAFNSPGGPGPQ